MARLRSVSRPLGLCAITLALAWACGSQSDSRAGAQSGGQGGAGVTAEAAASASSGSGGGIASLCQQACDKVDHACGLSDLCAKVMLIHCGDAGSDCPAQCILQADCKQVATLTSPTPNPDLLCCLQACQQGDKACDPCRSCAASKCGPLLQPCSKDPACTAFVDCGYACHGSGAGACLDGCLAAHDDMESETVAACMNQNCGGVCPPIGHGGTGGAGGAGGGGSGTGGGAASGVGGAGGAH